MTDPTAFERLSLLDWHLSLAPICWHLPSYNPSSVNDWFILRQLVLVQNMVDCGRKSIAMQIQFFHQVPTFSCVAHVPYYHWNWRVPPNATPPPQKIGPSLGLINGWWWLRIRWQGIFLEGVPVNSHDVKSVCIFSYAVNSTRPAAFCLSFTDSDEGNSLASAGSCLGKHMDKPTISCGRSKETYFQCCTRKVLGMKHWKTISIGSIC